MPSINKAILIGHLGGDPKVTYMPDGTPVARISLATTEKWKDKNGEKQEKTEWHHVVFFRKLAEIVREYLKKGRPVYIEGRLETKKWTDKDGIDRYTTQIVASDMKMLGSKQSSPSQPEQPEPETATAEPSNGFEDMEDDIPF